MRLIDLSGARFGRLVVVGIAGKKGKRLCWLCKCDCGSEHLASGDVLKNGHVKSCGCLKAEVDAKGTRFRHGLSKSSEHKIWCGITERCHNKKSKFFMRYGGRGITVCRRWKTFENFYADMGPRPSSAHTLDRVNNNGNYEPSNCRWATPEEQANNKSSNVMISIDGETKTLAQWCRETGVDSDLASQRINREKWSPVDAVTTPPRHLIRP